MLDGIRAAGKTGTTNAYRDAWFVGYTGNLAAAVWYGNDDHTSTNSMTGGTLPAMTWKEVMAFAHQNLELKPIPGLDAGPAVAFASARAQPSTQAPGATAPAVVPGSLSRRSYEVIDGIGTLFRRTGTGTEGARAANDGAGPPAGARVAMP